MGSAAVLAKANAALDAATKTVTPVSPKAAKGLGAAPSAKKMEKDASNDASSKKANLEKLQKDNAVEMKSNAAIWAGSGAPPPLTAGDVETMSARKAGFDATL